VAGVLLPNVTPLSSIVVLRQLLLLLLLLSPRLLEVALVVVVPRGHCRRWCRSNLLRLLRDNHLPYAALRGRRYGVRFDLQREIAPCIVRC